MAVPAEPGDSKFTVFIRLPFPRDDFVDPPPASAFTFLGVEWDAAKDQALWDVLSRPSKGDDIDWKALAESFDVTLQFLLQQAAWLYDRQLTQVRAQMRKVGTAQSSSPSPMLGSASGSTALHAPGKGAQGPRPSRLATQQKDTPPQRAIPRRTSSNATINQLRSQREQSHNVTPTAELKDQKPEGLDRPPVTRQEPAPAPVHRSPKLEEEVPMSSESESESEDEDEDMDSRRNPLFRRPGKFSIHRPGLRDDEEDDDESPAFLPLSRETRHSWRENSGQDLNETLRLNSQSPAVQRRRPAKHNQAPRNPVTTESSASSASSGVPVSLPDNSRRTSRIAGPLSPRRTAELARSSPRRSTGSGRETSDGTPSMGSSFSDLDDASVTQSALEEALLSNMQGGMASRVSTFLRSRYQ